MTDMLKKSEKINTSDAYVKSDNLTEQWKKGKLPEGHYYVKDGENMIAEYLDGYFYNNGLPMTSFSGGVDKVLAEVPSYEEWQAKLEENTKLKDLLKECRECFELLTNDNSPWCPEGADTLLTKINQVLGEE